MSPSNVRNRVLARTMTRANERLAEAHAAPLPDGLTPQSLRRTFASLLYAIGEPAPVVMQELGHTHPGLALRIYATPCAATRTRTSGKRGWQGMGRAGFEPATSGLSSRRSPS